MAGRPRCVHCRRAFTPDPRNRTKVENRQCVCPDCGSVIGHRYADRRYRASRAAPPRPRRAPDDPALRPEVAQAAASDLPDVHRQGIRPSGAMPASELANQVAQHLAAIAALVGTSAGPDGCGGSKPLPVGIDAKSSLTIT